MVTRSKAGVFKLKALIALKEKEPNSVAEALASQEWLSTMKEEYKALQHNQTWTLVPLPQGRKAIRCKRVFRIKKC